MTRVVLHADLNNFYASVTCLTNPVYRETPLAVCGDVDLRHGIVLAKNMLAKKMGVTTGQAVWQAKQICPGMAVLKPDFPSYLHYSGQVRAIFSRYTDHVEPFGIDEAWLDISGPAMSMEKGVQLANHLRHAVREELGLTISVGVSDNKIFAKLGSDLKKPDAVSLVCNENRAYVLDPLPVGDLLFVGRATQRRLNRIGIYTVGQLTRTDPAVLHSLLGKTGITLSHFAHGQDDTGVMETIACSEVKSVGNSITAARDVTTPEEARITLYGLCESVAERLRKQRLEGRTVSVSLRTAQLEWCQRQTTLPACTNLCRDIFGAAYALYLSENTAEPLRSMGVSMHQLKTQSGIMQLSFLPEAVRTQRQQALEETVDAIRTRYGHFSIQRAIMMGDPLGRINPTEEHIIHPVGYFK